MDEGWSIVEVNRVGGRSRLTSYLAVAPVENSQPQGRGRLQYRRAFELWRRFGLRVRCGRGAELFLGTQAFTKVYKATDGQVARQEVVGHLESGACVVSLPDPVVPYADSAFVQEQVWHLGAGTLPVLLDGGTAGRDVRGERFHYGSYTSNMSIYLENELVLAERLRLLP